MATSFFASLSNVNPRFLACQNGLPPPADHLLRQISLSCAGLLGFASRFPSFGADQHHRTVATLRTPPFSALGLASLLLGISSTLMLFGSFAFMVGFMLMPLIVPVMFVVCMGALCASVKAPLMDLRAPSSSSSSRNTKTFRQN